MSIQIPSINIEHFGEKDFWGMQNLEINSAINKFIPFCLVSDVIFAFKVASHSKVIRLFSYRKYFSICYLNVNCSLVSIGECKTNLLIKNYFVHF